MLVLERLRSDHGAAVYHFETANRDYFNASITDRGDEYFANFAQHHQTSLDEQASGQCAYYLLVDDDGAVVGRFNLYDIADGEAEVGYRVAGPATGRGVATEALRTLCEVARSQWALRTLRARTSDENVASQRVLEKCGFVVDGVAEVGGRPGRTYRYSLEPASA